MSREFKESELKNDVYIPVCGDSGDRSVSTFSGATSIATLKSLLGASDIKLTDLFSVDRDNDGNIIKTISIYDFQVPPESIEVGESIKISDLGQIPSYSTKFDNKQFLMMGYEFTENGSMMPTVKVFGEPTSFELQPLDDVTETFNTPVEFDVVSQQDVIGLQYNLKISAETDVRFNVIRKSEGLGKDTILVDELIPKNDLNINGTIFDLSPIVDFESNKVYTLMFSTESGSITIKGTNATEINEFGVGLSSNVENFIPYIKREKGYVYETKNIALEGESGSQVVQSATPPNDTSKLWFNTTDDILYFYDGSNWLSEQLFSVEFNEQGSTPNNTFFRIGNTTTNDLGVGFYLDFDVKIEKLKFSRTAGTAQMGNYWLYSNRDTGTNNATVICFFTVDDSPRGVLEPNVSTDIDAGSYISMRWNGVQTNNNIVSLSYRKKYVENDS